MRDCLLPLVARGNVVGFDLVEVALPYDSSQLTAPLGAPLIVDFLATQFPSE